MVYQFRYGGNYSNIDKESLMNGTFIQDFKDIYQLGIQAPPGTAFSLNGSSLIFVGNTGIYELDLRYVQKAIASIKFEIIPEGNLLIDIAYGAKAV